MGAEMDCCDSTDDGRRFYVELKTNREVLLYAGQFLLFLLSDSQYLSKIGFASVLQIDSHGTEEYFEKDKLLRIWVRDFHFTLLCSSFLSHIIIYSCSGLIYMYLCIINLISFGILMCLLCSCGNQCPSDVSHRLRIFSSSDLFEVMYLILFLYCRFSHSWLVCLIL